MRNRGGDLGMGGWEIKGKFLGGGMGWEKWKRGVGRWIEESLG